jgi:hypothetical protein
VKAIRLLSVLLLSYVATIAILVGYALIKDPSGNLLELPLKYLDHTPFNNYLIPGIILFIVHGVTNVIAAIFTAYKWKHYPTFVVWQSIILILWILLQMLVVQHVHPLYLLFGSIGILLFMFGNRLNV